MSNFRQSHASQAIVKFSRRDVLRAGLAALPIGFCSPDSPSFAADLTDTIRIENPRSLLAADIPCERISLGEPGDYKPCIAQLPDGELLLTAFHQHKKEGGKVLEQNLLFRSRDGGNPDLEARQGDCCVAFRGSVWMPAIAGMTTI